MYIRKNPHEYPENIIVPDNYSGSAFSDNSTNTYEAENVAEPVEEKVTPPEEPVAPVSKSFFSKNKQKKGSNTGLSSLFGNGSWLSNIFCNENILLIGLILLLLFTANDNDNELLIILLVLLFI